MKRLLLLVLLGVVVVASIVLLSQRNQPSSSNTFVVNTSFYPLYYFASQIAGAQADVRVLTPPGTEPHDYELTSQDLVSIEKGKLLIINGGNLEPWANDILRNLTTKTVVVVAGENLTTLTVQTGEQKIIDPHIWLNPVFAQNQVKNILQGFIAVDPQHSSLYESNAQKLLEQLNQLDTRYRKELQNCQHRDIVTAHAAFGYLAKEYRLNQVAIAGISPDEEPSAKKLAELARFAKDKQIKYIFFESLVSPKLSETLAQEIGAQTLVFNPLEGLTTEEIKQGKTYFTEMEQNLKNLKIALACQ